MSVVGFCFPGTQIGPQHIFSIFSLEWLESLSRKATVVDHLQLFLVDHLNVLTINAKK